MYDIIIIGKGPAGVSAAIYAARANKSVLVISKDFGWLATAEKIENYYGFVNPMTGMELLTSGIEQARRLGAEFLESEVSSIEKYEHFLITTTTATYESKIVIIATGLPRKKPGIGNLSQYEGRGVSYCATCDGFFYKGKNVGVLGNSDYTYKEASELLHFTKNVTIFTNGREYEGSNILKEDNSIVPNLRSITTPNEGSNILNADFNNNEKLNNISSSNNGIIISKDSASGGQETYTNTHSIGNPIFSFTDTNPTISINTRKISEIIGDERVEKIKFADGEIIPIDGIFVAEGTASALDLALKLGIENNGKTIIVNNYQETNIPGLYAAGDCTGGILQVSVAVGEGAIAAINAIGNLK